MTTRTLWPLLLSVLLLSQSQCTVGEDQRELDTVGYALDEPAWRNDFVGVVDSEVERRSQYASSDGGYGACVTTWTVGGAVLGEAASKACMVVGVATIETGVGGAAAAVCVTADWVGADAVLGAAAGYMSGYVACGASSVFDRYLGGFRLFDIAAEEDAEDGEDEAADDYNTPECAAKYDEYKQVCGQPSSCRVQGLSCDQLIQRHDANDECARLRVEHLYDCPHPEDFDWDGHQEAIASAYLAQQRCQENLCTSSCRDTPDPSLTADVERICWPAY